jgi:diadenosine tetraphosphate (Ap4A) HIT family hydrolase
MSEDCLFCQIASQNVPSTLLHEDELCVVLEDIFPKAPVHMLVIPKQHIASTLELAPAQEAVAGHLLVVGAALARQRGLAEKGFRMVFNTGTDAGQTVQHLHLHVLGGHNLGAMG